MALDDIKGYMIALILCICVIASGAFIIGSVLSSNPSLNSASQNLSQFNSTLNKAEDMTNTTTKMQTNINSVTSGGVGALGWINALFGAAFGGLQIVFQSLGFVGTMITGTAAFFGIPSVIVGLLIALTIVVTGIAIWSAITRN